MLIIIHNDANWRVETTQDTRKLFHIHEFYEAVTLQIIELVKEMESPTQGNEHLCINGDPVIFVCLP